MSHATTEVIKDKLFKDFNAVVVETEEFLSSVANAGADKAGSLRASVVQCFADTGARIAKVRDESLGQAHAAAHATDDYVQANPWRAIGIAATLAGLIGLVAGMLIARR